MGFDRRLFLGLGAAAGATTLLGTANRRAAAKSGRDDDSDSDRDDGPGNDNEQPGGGGNLFGYTPFTQDLYIPPVMTDLEPGALGGGGTTAGGDSLGYLTPADVFARGPISPTGDCNDVTHGIAPEFGLCPDWNQTPASYGMTHAKEFRLVTEETLHRFFGPGGPQTPIFSYRDGAMAPGSGATPGPTFLVDYLGPAVVRNCNLLTRDRSAS